jgi:hypothetical protein
MRVCMVDLAVSVWAATRVRAADTCSSASRSEHHVKLFFCEISIEVRNIDAYAYPSAAA